MMNSLENRDKDYFQRIPKIELHLHLEGAVRTATVKELAARPGIEKPALTPEDVGKIDKYQGLTHFVTTMKTLMDTCLRSPQDYERVAYELFSDLAAQNVVYAEVSFDPIRGLRLGIPYDEMLNAVYEAKVVAEKEFGITIGLLIGLGRERGYEVVADFARKAAVSQKFGVVGLDLHGDEQSYPPALFMEAYDVAKTAGLGLRAHAGEGAGPDSIWQAIDFLGVTRIAHGIRAMEDQRLIDYLASSNITLDICPTSNYRLGYVESLHNHPVRFLFDAGIKVTISTDDPFFFNTSITREYEVLAKEMRFTGKELEQITLNAVNGAFLPDSKKKALSRIIKTGFGGV